ncbi:hypothetical protein EDD66_105298 [Mobilisporobacter senegalensis]|uniref:Uncharacterized protein n=1 Tax=Mobilisporobacter senegalensis TaxID=1329262 RepID=A0A3N1XNY5_9FIRM|nr:hypothetical protein [Mobilisporobacter senegalensis]ROR28356.1 hypothetical protein EDD66_105298 [Mobilisporobacter senegalensis]
MAKYTKNYNLEKQQNNEYISIDGLNNNFDKIDKVLGNTGKFESAGGTATAIILSDVILEDGAGKTFKVISGNGGASTTINGKKLYKPGTTAAPTLIAGKAVTIWYDEAGDCFFIKASAEGNATADHVLAGKTFSNDNDTGLIGNIPILTGIRTPSGIAKWADGALAVYPEKGYQKGGAGDGEIKVTTDKLQSAEPALISSNIKSGVSIYGVAGSMATPGFYNFPLSIQESQPTAVKNGHIWVKSSATFSKIQIVDAFTAGVADGTLMFVVGDTTLRKESISHSIKTTDNKSVIVSTSEIDDSSADWLVSNISGDISTSVMLRRPMVYSKLGGLLDVETAHMWDGNSWKLISQKGSYLAIAKGGSGPGYGLSICNVSSDTYVRNVTTLAQGSTYSSNTTYSSDGRYLAHYNIVFQRIGDVYSSFWDVPSSVNLGGLTYNSVSITTISGDGNTVASLYRNNGNNDYVIIIFKNNGNTFVQLTYFSIGYTNSIFSISMNYAGTMIVYSAAASGSSQGSIYAYYKNTDGSYSHNGSVKYGVGYPFIVKFNKNYSRIVSLTGLPSRYNLSVYTFNESNRTVTLERETTHNADITSTIYPCGVAISNTGFILTTGYPNSPYYFLYNYIQGRPYSISGLLGKNSSHSAVFDFNSDGTRLAISVATGDVYIYAVSVNESTFTMNFTLIKSLGFPTNSDTYAIQYFP